MKMKNTPGPWYANGSRYGTIYIEAQAVIDKRLLQEVCAVGPVELGREQQEANARLIAAAPELLEAVRAAEALTACCMSIDGYSRQELHDIGRGTVETFRAAIAKATGT